MARAKRTNKWKNLGVQIDEELYNKLKAEAEKENRTLTATIEVILRQHYELKSLKD